MTENPKFVDQFINLIDPDHKEVTLTSHAKLAKIQNSEGATFWGILMDKSIIIPFTANIDTDEAVKNIVALNNMDLDKEPGVPHVQTACKQLGLCYNGKNEGFYSDSAALSRSNIMVLHIYPEGYVNSQEDFIESISKVFQSRGSIMTIEETL